MSKEFSNLNDMISYIEKQQSKVSKKLGDAMVDIMKEEVQTQVYSAYSPRTYNRTGDMINSPQIEYFDKNQVSVAFMNMGSWTSYGGTPFHAIIGLEAGKTYGVGGYRPKTNLMETSFNKIENKIPNVFLDYMRSQGIPIS